MKPKYAGLVGHAESRELPFIEQAEARVVHRPAVATPVVPERSDQELMMEFLFGDAAPHIEGAVNLV